MYAIQRQPEGPVVAGLQEAGILLTHHIRALAKTKASI
jgi:hypothetical protein